MSPFCSIAVTIVALAIPLADLAEAVASVGDLPGIARPQSHQVAAAEVEADAGTDDVDDHPHDRGWQAGGAVLMIDIESARCGSLHVPPGSDVRGGCPTTAIIRGPPACG
jgi:hypothetical protein